MLALRQSMQPHQPLTPKEALRELLHDAEEALMGGFDPVSPLRPHLGAGFQALADRLRSAVAARYGLPAWESDDLVLHKRADRLAAASEALHVVGWPREEVRDTLGIPLAPLQADPLPLLDGLLPWQPWPPRRAAALFLFKLRELQGATHLEHPASLAAAIEREKVLAYLAGAFQRLAPGVRSRCAQPVTGSILADTWVSVEADDSSQRGFEGVIVGGDRDEDGAWELDGEFTVFTEDEELLRVRGWSCTVEVL